MDTHGLTWTPDAFGMKIYNQETAIGLLEVFIGSNYSR